MGPCISDVSSRKTHLGFWSWHPLIREAQKTRSKFELSTTSVLNEKDLMNDIVLYTYICIYIDITQVHLKHCKFSSFFSVKWTFPGSFISRPPINFSWALFLTNLLLLKKKKKMKGLSTRQRWELQFNEKDYSRAIQLGLFRGLFQLE